MVVVTFFRLKLITFKNIAFQYYDFEGISHFLKTKIDVTFIKITTLFSILAHFSRSMYTFCKIARIYQNQD